MEGEHLPLLSNSSERRAKRLRYIASFLIILANLLESVIFYVLELKIFDILVKKYQWPEDNVSVLSTQISIFLIYMGFFGGILADFFVRDVVLVIVSYIIFIFCGLSLSFMNINATGDIAPKFTSIFNCVHNSSRSPTAVAGDRIEDLDCSAFSYSVLFILGFGNGLILPILYAFSCHQVRMYGPKYISAVFFLNHGFHNLGICFAHFAVNYVENITNIFILYGCCSGISLISLLSAFKFGERNNSSISFCSFLNQLKGIIFSAFNKVKEKKADDRTSIVLQTDEETETTLNNGVKRLMTYVTLVCFLIFPACILNRLMDLFNKQSLYMLIPVWLKPHLSHANLNLMVNNLNIVNEITIILFCIGAAVFTVKHYQCDRVMSQFWRIVTGSILAMIAFYYGGVVEHFRLLMFWGLNNDSIRHSDSVTRYYRDNKTYDVANISLFYLCPSYILLGLSETLIFVTALEYAYLYCPPWLRYTAVGLAFLPWGSGALGGIPFKHGLDKVLYNLSDINCRLPCETNTKFILIDSKACWFSHLDYVYYTTASVMLVFFIIMVIIKLLLKPDRFHALFWEQMSDPHLQEICSQSSTGDHSRCHHGLTEAIFVSF